MWIARELLRFVGRIAIALLIAIVIAEARALISGGDTLLDVPHRADAARLPLSAARGRARARRSAAGG